MTIAKLQELQNAYEWEQMRIKAWMDDLNQHSFADNDRIPNAMVAQFHKIWIAYFNEIRASNQAVVDICEKAIKTGLEETATQAIHFINETYHDRPPLEEIQGSTNTNKEKSRYFQAIDEGLKLELRARDEINDFLKPT
jgi:hypothetical protein